MSPRTILSDPDEKQITKLQREPENEHILSAKDANAQANVHCGPWQTTGAQ